MPKPRVIYWFRTDLRLHDSPALRAALDLSPECLYPVFTWDPHYVYRARGGPNRWQYLLDCMEDLSKNITKVNKKSQLFVVREAPQTVLPKLFKAWKISHLVFEKDTDAYARDRDSEVTKLAEKAGVKVVVKSGRTLWDSDELVKANHGKATMSIGQVQNAAKTLGEPARPIDAPKKLPDPGSLDLSFKQDPPDPNPDFNAPDRNEPEHSYEPGLRGPKKDFAVPTLEELGIKAATTPHRGGESKALASLDKICKDKQYVATFAKPNTAPTAFEPQSTCLLSPHLHFGSLSCRLFYWRAVDISAEFKGKATGPPTSLTGQLMFRDMYFGAQAAGGYQYAQTVGNSHCRFIPWHLPSRIDSKNKLITGEYEIDDNEAEIWFKRWRNGMTGFPWIDALMRQLREEGWIHHLGRHAVACFLTRGGCYVDWERGAEVFEEWLLDHEIACNAGNWQWLSCTAFFSQFYRCYSPIKFPEKWDKEGDFVRRYCPELKDIPKKYIYEPWKAPIPDQKDAGVLIKGDGSWQGEKKEGKYVLYPKPMFDFSERREICLSAMKQAYDVGLYGNDKKVLDGTWRNAFPDSAEGPTKGKKGPIGAMLGGSAKVSHVEENFDYGGEDHTADGDRESVDEGKGKKGSEHHKRKASKGPMDAHVKKSKS